MRSFEYKHLSVFVGLEIMLICSCLCAEHKATHVTAASEPRPTSVAEPNLAALLGIANPLAAQSDGGFFHGLGGHQSVDGGGSLPDLKSLCNGANSDALSKLLVYQYLSGSLPASSANSPNSGNPQLQALLEGSLKSKTSSAVITTTTLRTLTLDAKTKYSTATSSYVTTVTSLASSVIPIIFRGSKITTTITDRTIVVLTATEFSTRSSVITPSIIQTLPVEITLLQTSTRGLNGHYTLAIVNPGATKVIEQPISTKGIDLSSLGFSSIDLSSFTGGNKHGGDSQMVNALTALLKQYSNDEVPTSNGKEEGKSSLPRSRFHSNRASNHPQRRREENEDPPKFNVIRGFTLSDRNPPREGRRGGGNSGTALENTRYSKFRKKNNVENNSLVGSPSDRESERFSASTDRRTVSRADRRTVSNQRRRGRQRSSSRDPSRLTGRSISGGDDHYQEELRQQERNRRRSESINNIATPNVIWTSPDRRKFTFKTSVLTMHISGTRPGQVVTTTRTVTLRSFTSNRFKRHVEPSTTATFGTATNTVALPQFTNDMKPDEVVGILKTIDRSVVKSVLYSLKDWVEFYVHEVLGESIEKSSFLHHEPIQKNEIPELLSSINENEAAVKGATSQLGLLPDSITKRPITQVSSCPQPTTVTETSYRTVYTCLSKT